MAKMNLVGIVSADIIGSTSLSELGFRHLQREVHICFDDFARYVKIPFWGRLVKGDAIECCVDNPNYVLRLALLMKCRIKAWADAEDCSPLLKAFGLRFSMAVGAMRIVDRNHDIMDGEAIYIAGRGLDRITRSSVTSTFGMVAKDAVITEIIKNEIQLLDNIVNALSAKQSAVIYLRLLGMTEMEISRILRISQSSVNSRAKGGGWHLIAETLRVFESINFSNYVY
ncbi:MAG: hypothetical protein J6Q71_07000 [Bacteroidales bacterium]|jgi:hypothetical protein|nr:hypothetical protein [Bacteroidales bacterium]